MILIIFYPFYIFRISRNKYKIFRNETIFLKVIFLKMKRHDIVIYAMVTYYRRSELEKNCKYN